VGDNIQDFPKLSQSLRDEADAAFGAFGTRYFVLPNPMYGSWERN
jgi:predicted secreted acid phosphatase